LEPLQGRYTEQLSRANTGWNERNWKAAQIPYVRIEGPNPTVEASLAGGKVINTVRRCEWAFAQTSKLVQMIADGTITSSDAIYFDDFWHPGLEMIGQAIAEAQCPPSLYSFCHAQSVDMFDFMWDRRRWASHIEHGFARLYDRVFVNNDTLAELLHVRYDNAYVVNCGHPFSTEEVVSTVPLNYLIPNSKSNTVVFSSRFDREKQPHLFMDIVEATLKKSSNIKFVVCSGGPLRSDDDSAVSRAIEMGLQGKLTLATNLTKAAYYKWLKHAKLQLSTSLQDWVSYSLLEALSFGCYPVYPNYRSFPEVFGPYANHLYPFHPTMDRGYIVNDVSNRIINLCKHETIQMKDAIADYVLGHHNMTWARMAVEMDLLV
jgi:glycosyltransferase involved in cell wall biosynthesis